MAVSDDDLPRVRHARVRLQCARCDGEGVIRKGMLCGSCWGSGSRADFITIEQLKKLLKE